MRGARMQRGAAGGAGRRGVARGAVARALAAAVAAGVVGGCGSGSVHEYGNNDLQLLTGYTAKDMCSCLFVMHQTEDFCTRWTRATPNIKTVRVDWQGQAVEAQSVLFFGARAHYVDRRRGCVVE